MEEKFLSSVNSQISLSPDVRICVCLSGGADSCALLHCLMQLQKKTVFELSACHFNHRIRADESLRDENFCIELCKSYGIPLFLGSANIPLLHKSSGQTLEECARTHRYAWFETLANEHSIQYFATAHHMDDQAETILFRLFRGTDPKGLSGISATRGIYIRPFLNIEKSEILEYIKKHELCFVEDSSNQDTNYTRNYIRHVILPQASKVNPNASRAICRVSRLISEDDEFLEGLLPKYSEKQYVADLHDVLLRRLIHRNFHKISDSVLGYKHLDKIMLGIKNGKSFRYEISRTWTAVFHQGILSFEQQGRTKYTCAEGVLTSQEQYLCENKVHILIKNTDTNHTDHKNFSEFKNVYNLSTEIQMSYDRICGKLRYRARRPGDRILLKGHHRSIKKMMCDCKIKPEIRSMIPVIYDDEGIICVPFLGVADRVCSSSSERIIKLQIDIASDFD